MSEGTDLLAEGTEVPILGGTARLRYSMLSLVRLEEKYGGLQEALGELMPGGRELKKDEIPPQMFTKILGLVHLGFLDYGWSFEETCSKLLPRHLAEYVEALSKELSMGAESPGEPSAPKLPR